MSHSTKRGFNLRCFGEHSGPQLEVRRAGGEEREAPRSDGFEPSPLAFSPSAQRGVGHELTTLGS